MPKTMPRILELLGPRGVAGPQLPVQVRRLQHPLRHALVVESPHHRNKQEYHAHPAQGGPALVGPEGLAQPRPQAGGRHPHVMAAAQPEREGRHTHQHPRHPEGPGGPGPGVELGNEKRGQGRAHINAELEPAVGLGQQVGVGAAELVAEVGRNARLDAAHAHGHHQQPQPKAGQVVGKRGQQGVAAAVEHREPKNDAVLAQHPIGQQGPHYWQRVAQRREGMHQIVGPGLGRGRQGRVMGGVEELSHQKRGQNGPHAIVAEPLGHLVADDIRHRLRESGSFGGRGSRRHKAVVERLTKNVIPSATAVGAGASPAPTAAGRPKSAAKLPNYHQTLHRGALARLHPHQIGAGRPGAGVELVAGGRRKRPESGAGRAGRTRRRWSARRPGRHHQPGLVWAGLG